MLLYELYQTNIGTPGTMAEVWIDVDAGLVKKYYKTDGITITGKPPKHADAEEIKRLYDNEIFWSTKLQSEFVVRTLEHGPIPGRDGWYILQEYHGPNLLYYFNVEDRLDHMIPDAANQIEEMFGFWQQHGVYKINNAMSNMVLHNGRIKAFDFKYATHRSAYKRYVEHGSIVKWVSKIDTSLIDRLERFL